VEEKMVWQTCVISVNR